jgi:hypothetical protein
MPQTNGAPQREQAALLLLLVGVGEGADGTAQELELVACVAAAVADRQVRAQGDALGESERAILPLR